MNTKVLLITPPFTQLNTPYPATAYIKGYLNTLGVDSEQLDLGIETILHIFSEAGLQRMFAQVDDGTYTQWSENARRIYRLRDSYIHTIGSVISYLQDQDPTLAHLISERNFLPEASKFQQLEDLEWAFGSMGIRDKARHIATLYLEDISDFIVEVVDTHFGFSRYAERLGLSAHTFDELYNELQESSSHVANEMLHILDQKIVQYQPDLLCISVPFPGNLFAGLKCGQYLKSKYPTIKIAMGGGYPNTELRSLRDTRIFEYVDFITLDDGETPLKLLIEHLEHDTDESMLKRTLSVNEGAVVYNNGSLLPDVKQESVGTPDYDGLPLRKYLSVIQLTNPMHRLWSDGRWNKLTMAHGCYWGKCTFCDISLDYIKNYEASSATTLVDRMEELIAKTGQTGFHFVDEAAPPALMKALALEILKRNLVVNWWTNIRFEKSFTLDLCKLLAASGCIAVSGGLEVASDRLLKLIAKGVTIAQVSVVNDNFFQAGIMVHAYLMYGFPTQTAQETIDSLEVVRQMFEVGILQSAFWHRFAMTAHSPVGMYPEKFKVNVLTQGEGSFANNDREHEDPTGTQHDLFSEGLKKSLYNYMHGVCIDHPLQKWFDHPTPETSLPQDLIAAYLDDEKEPKLRPNHTISWIGGPVTYDEGHEVLNITGLQEDFSVECPIEIGEWFVEILSNISPTISISEKTVKKFQSSFEENYDTPFESFWESEIIQNLRSHGLVVV